MKIRRRLAIVISSSLLVPVIQDRMVSLEVHDDWFDLHPLLKELEWDLDHGFRAVAKLALELTFECFDNFLLLKG